MMPTRQHQYILKPAVFMTFLIPLINLSRREISLVLTFEKRIILTIIAARVRDGDRRKDPFFRSALLNLRRTATFSRNGTSGGLREEDED